MTAPSTRRRASRRAPPTRSVEERLHELEDDLLLVASLFDSHAVAPDYLRADLLAAPACRAASALVARSARTVRELRDRFSPEVLNAAGE